MTAFRWMVTTMVLFCVLLIGLLTGCKAARAEEPWTQLDGPLTPGGVVRDLAVAPSQPQTLYGLVGHPLGLRLFRSNDRSLSWTQVYTYAASQIPREIGFHGKYLAVDPDDPEVVYAALGNQLLASKTGGIQWRTVLTTGHQVVTPAPQTVYVIGMEASDDMDTCFGARLIFASSVDGGNQWLHNDLGCNLDVASFAVAPSQPERIYLTIFNSPKRENLMVSEDGGKSWTVRNSMLGSPGFLTVDPADPQHVLWGGFNTLAESKDGGQTWHPIGDGWPIVVGPVFASDGTMYVVGDRESNGVLFRSDDGGESWWEARNLLVKFPSTIRISPDDSDTLYVGYRGEGIFASTNRGGFWEEHNQGIYSPVAVEALAAPADDQVLFAGSGMYWKTRTGFFRSRDAGATWQIILTDTSISDIALHPQMESALAIGLSKLYYDSEDRWRPAELEKIDVQSIAISPEDANVRIFGGMRPISEYVHQGVIGVWDTSGGPGMIPSWRIIDLEGMHNVSAVTIDPQNPAEMYAAGFSPDGYGWIYHSTDGGKTWHQIAGQAQGFNSSPSEGKLVVEGNNLYSVSTSWGLQISQDRGVNWQNWSSKTAAGYLGIVRDVAFDAAGQIFIATDNGVFRWDRQKAIWTPFGLENRTVYTLLITGSETEQTLYAGTDFGIWRQPVPDLEPLMLWLPHIQGKFIS